MKLPESVKNQTIAARFLAVAAACLLFAALSVSAKTPAEYREGIKSAKKSAQELIHYVDEGEKNADYERETVAAIRRNLPTTEKIEWEGNTIETGNQWLEAKLKEFEETGDWEKRRLILTEIKERLAAIEEKINQLENPAAAASSKDEEKRRLAEILRRVEYQKPEEKEKSWFQQMQEKIRDWFRQKFPQPDIPETAPEGFQTVSFGLQMVLYALVLGFIAFLIYRFAPLFAERFRRKTNDEKGERVVLGEKLGRDDNAQTLFDEAEALARQGNLRGAIRKGYIALLCELSDRKIIGLAQHKTNRDYLRDVRKQDALYRNMNGLTRSFERHWYGFDAADQADWHEFKENYFRALKSEQ